MLHTFQFTFFSFPTLAMISGSRLTQCVLISPKGRKYSAYLNVMIIHNRLLPKYIGLVQNSPLIILTFQFFDSNQTEYIEMNTLGWLIHFLVWLGGLADSGILPIPEMRYSSISLSTTMTLRQCHGLQFLYQ